jgi:hypothetical protein
MIEHFGYPYAQGWCEHGGYVSGGQRKACFAGSSFLKNAEVRPTGRFWNTRVTQDLRWPLRPGYGFLGNFLNEFFVYLSFSGFSMMRRVTIFSTKS